LANSNETENGEIKINQKIDILLLEIIYIIINEFYKEETEKINLTLLDLYRKKRDEKAYPTSKKQLEPIIERLNILNQLDIEIYSQSGKIFHIKIDKNNVAISKGNLFDIFANIEGKEYPYFYLPKKILQEDSKKIYFKKFAIYLLYIAQIKYMKNDLKPIFVKSVFNGTNISKNKKFLDLIEETLKYLKDNGFIEYKYKKDLPIDEQKIFIKSKKWFQ